MYRNRLSLKAIIAGAALVLLATCSSTPSHPPEPAWIHQATRTLDSGYLVYIGTGVDATLEGARFKAEAAALEDLANECSFAPKGTRTEDRFEEPEGNLQRAYAKVALTFEECEQAKQAIQPDDVRRLANAQLAGEIKRYQDGVGGAGLPADTAAQNSEPVTGKQTDSSLPQPPPQTVVINDTGDYFIVRQQVFYAKQTLILAPPGSYAPNSVETIQYVNRITPAVAQAHGYEIAHPDYKTWDHAWSGYATRMRSPLPPALRPSAYRAGRPHPSRTQNRRSHRPTRRRPHR